MKYLLVIAILAGLGTSATSQTSRPPNIVLIYADDLGYSDLHCYGRDHGADFIETPYLDSLASRSMKFTNAYSAAR